MKKIVSKLNNRFWFIVILFYLSFINLVVIKSTPEIIALQFAALVLVFQKKVLRKFAKSWVPFVGFFLLYELLRGYADNLSPFTKTTLYFVHNLEEKIFPIIPTTYLQEKFFFNKFVLNLSLFFYTIFFYYSFLTAFIIWLKKRELFESYSRKFILLSFIGLALFFLIPTAPPWYVSKTTDFNILRLIYEQTIISHFSGVSLYQHFIYGNPVAAFPSLHVAWPAFTSLFLVKHFENKINYVFLIIPVAISFSVVLTGEHYLIDVIAGWLLAGLVTYLPRRRNNNQTGH